MKSNNKTTAHVKNKESISSNQTNFKSSHIGLMDDDLFRDHGTDCKTIDNYTISIEEQVMDESNDEDSSYRQSSNDESLPREIHTQREPAGKEILQELSGLLSNSDEM